MFEYTDNSNNDDYIDYFMVNAWWGNDWITMAFCRMCGITFNLESGNVYKLKKEYYDNLCFCEPCLLELKKRNVIKEWDKIELYWSSLQIPELIWKKKFIN